MTPHTYIIPAPDNPEDEARLNAALVSIGMILQDDMRRAANVQDAHVREVQTQLAEMRYAVSETMLRYQAGRKLPDTRYVALMSRIAHELCVAAAIVSPEPRHDWLMALFKRIVADLRHRKVIPPAQMQRNMGNGLMGPDGRPIKRH